MLKGMGWHQAAKREMVNSAFHGPPRTMDEALMRMDDRYRVMLLSASKGDRRAQKQAIATLDLR